MRISNGEVDPTTVRSHLESTADAVDDETVADCIVERMLPCDRTALPPRAATAVDRAARALVDGAEETAVDILAEAFPSPCERHRPDAIHVGSHRATCHRADSDAPGTPLEER